MDTSDKLNLIISGIALLISSIALCLSYKRNVYQKKQISEPGKLEYKYTSGDKDYCNIEIYARHFDICDLRINEELICKEIPRDRSILQKIEKQKCPITHKIKYTDRKGEKYDLTVIIKMDGRRPDFEYKK